ncbi:MAG TPA: cytochrome c oxidase assembly protein [Solirubrobacteraceae bacterium]|nr:cytochrome c oxidase assembly protein [Solirubrobacteraceae bacterium]
MSLSALPLASAGPINGIVPSVVVLLFWLPYRARVRTLSDERRAVPGWRQACFAAGLITLAIALSAPVDSLADQLLVAHMAEHLVIGDISALLIVLGFTGPLLAPLLRKRWLSPLRVFAHPLVALPAWMISFYTWHLPVLYQAALRHDLIHGLQHACFLAFGIAVWMPLLGPLPKPAWFTNAARLIYIIIVRLAGTVLANVLIFSGTVLYPIYRAGDAKWHISPMGDQIAAAGLMMVEESLLTIGLFCWLFMKVAAESDERQRLLDAAAERGVELDERRAARAVAAGRGQELLDRVIGGETGAPARPTTTVSEV